MNSEMYLSSQIESAYCGNPEIGSLAWTALTGQQSGVRDGVIHRLDFAAVYAGALKRLPLVSGEPPAVYQYVDAVVPDLSSDLVALWVKCESRGYAISLSTFRKNYRGLTYVFGLEKNGSNVFAQHDNVCLALLLSFLLAEGVHL